MIYGEIDTYPGKMDSPNWAQFYRALLHQDPPAMQAKVYRGLLHKEEYELLRKQHIPRPDGPPANQTYSLQSLTTP